MGVDQIATASLDQSPHGPAIARVLAAALEAVQPRQVVRNAVRLVDGQLSVRGRVVAEVDDKKIWVTGAGKAGLAMALGLVEALGTAIDGGVVVVKRGTRPPPSVGNIEIRESAHPIPDASSVDAARAVLAVANQAREGDVVLCLISGGASSLLTLPAGQLGLSDVQDVTTQLLASGADIAAVNGVRSHLDQLKGGGLATAAAPAIVVTLAISDVAGDNLSAIGSGPTAAPTHRAQTALGILERYCPAAISKSIRAHLGRADQSASPPGPPPTSRSHSFVLATNQTAVDAACTQARAEGFSVPEPLTLSGEAREAGVTLGRRLATVVDPTNPTLVVAGGETTVTLKGDGLGGRNQEVALAASTVIFGLPNVLLATFATDGEDGNTEAAGAVATGQTVSRALALGHDPLSYLARNDSTNFFCALDDLITTGSTGTNVCDLALLVSWP